jgi:hypothetical protein
MYTIDSKYLEGKKITISNMYNPIYDCMFYFFECDNIVTQFNVSRNDVLNGYKKKRITYIS